MVRPYAYAAAAPPVVAPGAALTFHIWLCEPVFGFKALLS